MSAQVEEIQTATVDFFGPIAMAYVAVCIVWLVTRLLAGSRWQEEPIVESDRPWLDFGMILVAAIGTFGLGAAYRNDLLIPDFAEPWNQLSTAINLCIPFLPIFLILLVRRQSIATVWISGKSLKWKIGAGILSAAAGLIVFLGLRGEFHRFSEVRAGLVSLHSRVHAVPVFLEAVAVAFVFVRLRWVTSAGLALMITCLLFAAAHIPGGIADGDTLFEIVSFFVFNTLLSAFIFSIVIKSRDVIWIAIPHFVLDIAIGAFG